MIGELIKRLRPIRYYLQRPFHKKHASKISGYKNSRIGESVTIVCNGPSLNSTDLSRINMPTIGMNKINLIFEKQKKWATPLTNKPTLKSKTTTDASRPWEEHPEKKELEHYDRAASEFLGLGNP